MKVVLSPMDEFMLLSRSQFNLSLAQLKISQAAELFEKLPSDTWKFSESINHLLALEEVCHLDVLDSFELTTEAREEYAHFLNNVNNNKDVGEIYRLVVGSLDERIRLFIRRDKDTLSGSIGEVICNKCGIEIKFGTCFHKSKCPVTKFPHSWRMKNNSGSSRVLMEKGIYFREPKDPVEEDGHYEKCLFVLPNWLGGRKISYRVCDNIVDL